MSQSLLFLKASLIEINKWIINFKNYIIQGYSDNVPNKGHYIKISSLLDDSGTTSLDRKNGAEKELEALCELLLEEGKHRMPKLEVEFSGQECVKT